MHVVIRENDDKYVKRALNRIFLQKTKFDHKVVVSDNDNMDY